MVDSDMSTQLYLKATLENAWTSSAHLRLVSPPMAIVTSILMYPQFIQELWYLHSFNGGALWNMVQMMIAWMGVALALQSLHSSFSHEKDVWAHFGFMLLGVASTAIFLPWNQLRDGSILLLMSISLYESGFHMRQHVMQALEYANTRNSTIEWREFRLLLHVSYMIIALGAGISLYGAAHTGHLL
jgi:hypothetical protein